MSLHTSCKSIHERETSYRPRLSETEKRENSRKASIKYYHSNPHVKERKRLRMAQSRAEKKLARRVSDLKPIRAGGASLGRYRMNPNGSAAYDWGATSDDEATPGDREAVAAYVLSNFCGPQGRRQAQGLQFAYDNGFCVHAQAFVKKLTEMGVEIPPDEEVHRKIAVNDECPANLFPRAPSPFSADEVPIGEVMKYALRRGLVPPYAVTPPLRVWARDNGYPVPTSLASADHQETRDESDHDQLQHSSDEEDELGHNSDGK